MLDDIQMGGRWRMVWDVDLPERGLLDQVVGVVVLPGEELLMCQGTVPQLD